MAKKSIDNSQNQSYEFSQLYREKKARIQESNNYEFIEFLNWIENVNKWKKKEDWKRLIDEWFNKYSDAAIVWLFNMFVKLKLTKPEWYEYEKILNEAKSAFKTEIYGENIVRQLFGRYGNYLKYLKRKRTERELEKAAKAKHEKADEVKQEKKWEVGKVLRDEWAENHYTWDDENIMNEDGDIVPNPKYEHIPVKNEYVADEALGINEGEEELESEGEKNFETEEEKKTESEEDGQLKIPFNFED